ncbi:MAG TPA: S9 family peptidase [Gemmatimonadales bacterium]|nr:S9 family peptidase [Gemmatimonadales bacterium]
MSARAAARAVLAATLLAAAGPLPLPAQEPRRLGVDEFVSLPSVGDPRPSPDGQLVAYTVSTPSLAENRTVSRIWVAETGSDRTWQATDGPGSDYAPRWSPDGAQLAFISTRGGAPQIWRQPARGGEPVPVGSAPGGVADFVWSPDGKAIFLVSEVAWPDTLEAERRAGEFPTEAKIWTHLFYRHWDDWRVGRRQHVFRLDPKTGELVDLTPFDRDVPPLALGGRDLAVSPVGTEIAVVYNPDSAVATSTNNDIFVMGPDGSGRQPITTNRANDHSPSYSPDSRYIAYLAMTVPGFESDRQQVILYERATGRRRALTADWDRSVGALAWTPDSRALVVEVEERGERALYRIEVPGGRRSRIVGGGVNSDVSVASRGGLLAFLRQSSTRPPEVFVAGLDGRGLRRLSRVHEATVARLELTPVEPFRFVGALGDTVHGWLMRPPGFDERRRYPVVYLIHGGPQGAWLDQWHPRWNYAMFAARGYVVAAVNFHGSTGYGQRFVNSVSRQWGGYPYDDLMKGLDHLATLPFVDRERVGAAGASYGGYMVYWMAGHTDRFRVLVAHHGVFNPLSMAGSTEELWFPIHEFGGSQLSPAARANMEKWSPANYIRNWSTPMLIVHGQRDYRVDVSEGLQAFTALKLRNVPGKFLYFPDEGHWVVKPRNRRLWWNTVLDWLDQWLK